MPTIADELVTVLAAEIGALRRLLPVLEAAEAALARADVPATARLLEQQEPALRTLMRLERDRCALLDRLASGLGTDAETLTLSRLLRLLPRPPAGLAALGAELRGLLERLLTLQGRNRFLVARALEYFEQLSGRLVSALALAPAPTYVASGQPGPSVLRRQLVDREA
jgi:flagellar biosynthesis/type III secretory pathway chaperone